MNENQQNSTDISAGHEVGAESMQNASVTTSTAPAAPEEKRNERPIIVGQTTSSGISENSLSTPVDALEGLTTGPVDNKNVKLEIEYTTPAIDLRERKDLDGRSEVMMFLAERSAEADERIRALVSPNSLKSGRGADWNESIVTGAMTSSYYDRRFDSTVNRTDADFRQYLQTESQKLGYIVPKVAESGTGTYNGEKAVMRVRSILGLGGIMSIPLWHSGIWVTLTAPQDGALIELFRRVQEEKIELGRETFGLVFSNEQSYINRFLLDFCLEHVYEHNVQIDSVQELRSLIKIQDLNILFWGLACLVWPRGFDYIRALTTKEGIENSDIVSAKISLGKLLWVDNASFDDMHKAHMLQRKRNAVTVKQVQEYQRTLVPSLADGRSVEIHENLQVIVDSTNVENYVLDGEQWINGIVNTVDATFTQAIPTEQDRNRMIATHARANKLRNYGAWVKKIIIDGIENEDRDDIANLLNVLSMDDASRELLEKEIARFIDDSTRVVIAIPETSGKETGLPRFPHLIPIDVINTFFTLLAQRVNIISRR